MEILPKAMESLYSLKHVLLVLFVCRIQERAIPPREKSYFINVIAELYEFIKK